MSMAIGPTSRHLRKASPSSLMVSSAELPISRLAEKADPLRRVTTAMLPLDSIAAREVLLVVYPARSRPNPIIDLVLLFQQLAVFLDVARHQLSEHFGRMLVGVGGDGREVVKTLLHRLTFDRGTRCRIQLRDDRRRRPLRREQAIPALRLEFRKACFQRRRQ